MIVFLLFILVVLIGLTSAAVMGRIGGSMSEPTSSHAFAGVPAEPLSADRLGALTFDTALRGYRMDQVDEVVDALVARLREVEADVDPLPADGAQLSVARASVPGEGADEEVARDAGDGVGEDAGLPAGEEAGLPAGEDAGLPSDDSRRSGPDRHGE